MHNGEHAEKEGEINGRNIALMYFTCELIRRIRLKRRSLTFDYIRAD